MITKYGIYNKLVDKFISKEYDTFKKAQNLLVNMIDDEYESYCDEFMKIKKNRKKEPMSKDEFIKFFFEDYLVCEYEL